ncbi:hypothetical protein B0T14DRAFT_584995 [Immersiella caudata]|uniref:Fe2OG dioxygenase domain-containing protein n=1 Tax=Immersiella caudata TaxID=314043 RepID=A0AA39WPY7_9PEZI|nr:hypothetical protein B0T14DRAFT_584995 [Immersiella caudata]
MTAPHRPTTPTIDPSTPNIQTRPSLGLTLITDFITPAEETTLISAFHSSTGIPPQASAKRRLSQHFGHHFDYTTFGASSSVYTPVPAHIAAILPRLPLREGIDVPPDQFTLQYYPPGAGIPPHVDTHSMFGEALYSLSFGSGVSMVFRLAGRNEARKMRLPKRSLGGSTSASAEMVRMEEEREEEREEWELMLPARSLLVMTGPSRYGYTHGIKGRKTDVVDGEQVVRGGRYSITMRSVRRGQEVGCACEYPGIFLALLLISSEPPLHLFSLAPSPRAWRRSPNITCLTCYLGEKFGASSAFDFTGRESLLPAVATTPVSRCSSWNPNDVNGINPWYDIDSVIPRQTCLTLSESAPINGCLLMLLPSEVMNDILKNIPPVSLVALSLINKEMWEIIGPHFSRNISNSQA